MKKLNKVPIKESEKALLSYEDTVEMRIILYRLVAYLQGDWKVWLPYATPTGQRTIEKLAEKMKANEKLWK